MRTRERSKSRLAPEARSVSIPSCAAKLTHALRRVAWVSEHAATLLRAELATKLR